MSDKPKTQTESETKLPQVTEEVSDQTLDDVAGGGGGLREVASSEELRVRYRR